MHEACTKCGDPDPEIIIATKTRPQEQDRQVLCLKCALEDSEVLRYLGEIAVRNARERGDLNPCPNKASESPTSNGNRTD